MSDLHLHLLLGGAVSVANDGDDAAQLHPAVGGRGWNKQVGGACGRSFNRKGQACSYSHASRGGGDDGDVLSLHWDGPRDVEVRGQLPHHHVPGKSLLLATSH